MPRLPHNQPHSPAAQAKPAVSPASAMVLKRLHAHNRPWYQNIGWLDILLPAALLAAFAGSIVGARRSGMAWLPGFEGTAYALIPSLAVLLLLHWAAVWLGRKLKEPAPTEAIWGPGFIYVPFAAYYASQLAQILPPLHRPLEGSEFFQVDIFYLWMLVAIGVTVLNLALGSAMLVHAKRAR